MLSRCKYIDVERQTSTSKTSTNPLSRSLQNSGIEKAFLFDVVSKIYIATDSSPVDMQSYELCSDMIDVVIDISCIYGYVGLVRVSVRRQLYSVFFTG